MTEALLDASKRRELEQERARAYAELRRLHQDLSATTERLNGVLSSIQDLVFSVLPGSFEVLYMNDNAEKIFGRPVADFKGDPFLWLSMVLPEDREAVEDDLARSRSTSVGDAEFRIRRPDGDIRWIRSRTRLVCDSAGHPLRLDGTCTDVTLRKTAEIALQESEERWRALVQNSSDFITVLKPDTEFMYLSPSVFRITGHHPEQLVGHMAIDRVHENDREAMLDAINRLVAGQEGPLQVDFRVRHTDGHWRNLEALATLMTDADGPRLIFNVRDVTDRLEAQRTISYMAYHDALTGLPNRALFRERKAEAIEKARRADKKVWVLSIDLDRFKIVNDTMGHSAGDELLRLGAERLSRMVRQEDTLARLGGDEFELLLTGCDNDSTAEKLAQRIIEAFRQPFVVHGRSCRTTVSIGISHFPDDGRDAETVLRHADIAMYAAKDAGRDTYRLYEASMSARDRGRLLIGGDLRLALERDELEVYYQPQVSVPTGEVVGVEALVRWHHPRRGLILPDEFIPVAEETGLIEQLGRQVLEKACEAAAGWERDGLTPIRLSVNVAYQQIERPDFVDIVREVVAAYPRAGHLQLEITESAVLKDFDLVRRVARELEALGVCLSIDDFGTGNTTLRYLNEFPICELKIDRSFVSELLKNPENATIVSSVISLGHSLKLSVIAEGVETEEQLLFLRERNCDEFQGFLHSKPMAASELRAAAQRAHRRRASRRLLDPAQDRTGQPLAQVLRQRTLCPAPAARARSGDRARCARTRRCGPRTRARPTSSPARSRRPRGRVPARPGRSGAARRRPAFSGSCSRPRLSNAVVQHSFAAFQKLSSSFAASSSLTRFTKLVPHHRIERGDHAVLAHRLLWLWRVPRHPDLAAPGAVRVRVHDVREHRRAAAQVAALPLALDQRRAFRLTHREEVAVDDVGGDALVAGVDHVEVAHLFVGVDAFDDDHRQRVLGEPLRLVLLAARARGRGAGAGRRRPTSGRRSRS